MTSRFSVNAAQIEPESCWNCIVIEEKERWETKSLSYHLVPGITLLANKGHSCVPAGASRRSPQDWNSSPDNPTTPGSSNTRGVCAISPPPGASTVCVPVPRISSCLLGSKITSRPTLLLVKRDLRQCKHCLKWACWTCCNKHKRNSLKIAIEWDDLQNLSLHF